MLEVCEKVCICIWPMKREAFFNEHVRGHNFCVRGRICKALLEDGGPAGSLSR